MSLKKILIFLLLCNISELRAQEDISTVSTTINNQPITTLFKVIELYDGLCNMRIPSSKTDFYATPI